MVNKDWLKYNFHKAWMCIKCHHDDGSGSPEHNFYFKPTIPTNVSTLEGKQNQTQSHNKLTLTPFIKPYILMLINLDTCVLFWILHRCF